MTNELLRLYQSVAQLIGRADGNLRASQLCRETDAALSKKLFTRARLQLAAATRIHRKGINSLS